MIIINIKTGTSVYRETYVHDANIALELGSVCSKRRGQPKTESDKPLILCIVSEGSVLPDESLFDEARQLQGHVKLDDLDFDETGRYMAHMLNAKGRVDQSIVEYVHAVGRGNPFGVELVCKELQARNVLCIHPEGGIGLAPGWEDSSQLYALPYPDKLVGVAHADFERFSHAQQLLLKIAAVCSSENTDASVFNSFSPLDIVKYIDSATLEEIDEQCLDLAQSNIFNEVSTASSETASTKRTLIRRRRSMSDTGPDKPQAYRIASVVLQHVASSLVLQAQRQQILKVMKKEKRRCSYTTNLEGLRGKLGAGIPVQEESLGRKSLQRRTRSDSEVTSPSRTSNSVNHFPS